MDAVGVADEVVVQPVVALLPRELPQGHVAHPWDGNNQISLLLVCWDSTWQVCLQNVNSLG